MRNHIAAFILLCSIVFPAAVKAQEKPAVHTGPEDEKVIAVLEILELMEMMDDISLYKDMEYLDEGEPNAPKD